jgi:hypothetical protein
VTFPRKCPNLGLSREKLPDKCSVEKDFTSKRLRRPGQGECAGIAAKAGQAFVAFSRTDSAAIRAIARSPATDEPTFTNKILRLSGFELNHRHTKG